MRYIGDTHGKMAEYKQIVNGCDASIQVGDFGAGFVTLPVLPPSHKFIRGNHDDPAVCAAHPNWIKDGTMLDADTFCVGGAYSIGRDLRIVGRDWWEDEEIAYSDWYPIMDSFEANKPSIMVTHDAPAMVATYLFPTSSKFKSRTSAALDTMFFLHQPKYWFFGHFHRTANITINGTTFYCLGELDYRDL